MRALVWLLLLRTMHAHSQPELPDVHQSLSHALKDHVQSGQTISGQQDTVSHRRGASSWQLLVLWGGKERQPGASVIPVHPETLSYP